MRSCRKRMENVNKGKPGLKLKGPVVCGEEDELEKETATRHLEI